MKEMGGGGYFPYTTILPFCVHHLLVAGALRTVYRGLPNIAIRSSRSSAETSMAAVLRPSPLADDRLAADAQHISWRLPYCSSAYRAIRLPFLPVFTTATIYHARRTTVVVRLVCMVSRFKY